MAYGTVSKALQVIGISEIKALAVAGLLLLSTKSLAHLERVLTFAV